MLHRQCRHKGSMRFVSLYRPIGDLHNSNCLVGAQNKMKFVHIVCMKMKVKSPVHQQCHHGNNFL